MIIKNIKVEVRPTATELATEFTNMEADQQAIFFNVVAAVSDEWRSCFAMQLQAITDSEMLTTKGREVMSEIGNYSEKIGE